MKRVALLLVCALVPTPASGQAFSSITPAQARLDPAALEQLLARAESSRTSALVLLRDGRLVGEWHFDGPPRRIETMSMTKSIVNLAIGRLIDDHKIKSVDEPLYTFFPEWKQGNKQTITLRHVLNHTSGLQAQRTTDGEIYPSPDFVRLALAAELDDPPGTKFFYNNKAVNLLAGVVQVAAGQPLDAYVREFLFTPLGITDFSWSHDRAGNPHAMSGLQLGAIDLARIGQMMLDGGVYRGRRIVSKAWIDLSTAPGQKLAPGCGLLWWLVSDNKVTIDDPTIAAWRRAGVEETFIARVLPMKGKVYTRDEFFATLRQAFDGAGGLEAWYDHTWRRGLPDGAVVPGPVVGYYADGWLGQYLLVLPRQRLVAVRQLAAGDDHGADEKKYDTWKDFPTMVRALVK